MMQNKKITLFRLVLVLSAMMFVMPEAVFAQQPQEIVGSMEQLLESRKGEGLVMEIKMSVPVVGSMTMKVSTLGARSKTEIRVNERTIVSWNDGQTVWTYEAKADELVIRDASAGTDGKTDFLYSLTSTHDCRLKGSTAEAWCIECTRLKSAKDKDIPRKITLWVDRKTHMPLSVKTTLSGAKMSIENIAFGCAEEDVTFDASLFEGVRYLDLRKQTP